MTPGYRPDIFELATETDLARFAHAIRARDRIWLVNRPKLVVILNCGILCIARDRRGK